MNILYCQGESDADRGTENWTESFNTLKEVLFEKGFEHIFMIPIGRMNVDGKYHQYDGIRGEQYNQIESDDRIVLASPILETMLDRGLMKDKFHYYQQAYNEVGKDAATNVARYLYNK